MRVEIDRELNRAFERLDVMSMAFLLSAMISGLPVEIVVKSQESGERKMVLTVTNWGKFGRKYGKIGK